MRFLVCAKYVATCSNLATSEGLTMKKPKQGAVKLGYKLNLHFKEPSGGAPWDTALFLVFRHSSERRPASARSHMARGCECSWKGDKRKIKESHMCVCFSSLDKHKLLLSRLKPMLLEKMDTVHRREAPRRIARRGCRALLTTQISHGAFCQKGYSVRSSQIPHSHKFHLASYRPVANTWLALANVAVNRNTQRS